MQMVHVLTQHQDVNTPDVVYGGHTEPSVITTTHDSNNSNQSVIIIDEIPCRHILYASVGHSSVDIWDLMILIPNVLFLLFLLVKIRRACIKLRKNDSPMFSVCLILVCVANLISLVRCIVSMCLTVPLGTSDRVIWLVLRFFLLATELSVIVFGFMFGHLDSRASIHRVLALTFAIALAYSFSQGALEFFSPNTTFHNITVNTGDSYYLFGHGGMMFWFVSSVVLSAVYLMVCILPFTALHRRFAIPTRLSFYAYCAILAALNTAQSVGCGLLYFAHEPAGWCVIDATAYLYFTGFAPLIYVTFLRSFFNYADESRLHISYQPQVDEAEQDTPYPHGNGSLYGNPQTNAHINANDGELFDDEASMNRQLLLPGWNWHSVIVGIPEVKNYPPHQAPTNLNQPPSA